MLPFSLCVRYDVEVIAWNRFLLIYDKIVSHIKKLLEDSLFILLKG